MNPTFLLALALTSLGAVAIVSVTMLSGWRGWLSLQQQRLGDKPFSAPVPNAGTRIEIADLKERIRKLEAIAAGVEL
ncbi:MULTISPECIES: hypothetical protein [unclassified Sphingomonas]|uniref:hypothetical protein n=1 Tax=unclassified Sphingomonas TaxID=196159 RepID=UPI0006F5DDDC|nr:MULTISPECIES: hypothetical protein [unclassified Sphingomonas]KQM98228.1 hypothetical protein ASE78_08245 [Sphingomonas sp. Leaf25]KQN37580.1 hypothetical protein ASE97_08420 [Sphingomonas sp. Leaf42]KQT27947.1 hypothetical protein ASG37_11130 [Sphingomonas sp. Leaf407]